MTRWIGRAPRIFSGLGLGVFATGLLIGAAGLTVTGCSESVPEGAKIEKIDYAKKGEDSMKDYMKNKGQNKGVRH